ncbi:MAG: aldehyde ferredoxin oxidoreductase family protein [Deltaproteobacteria bacterium]|nr:aldehyde ferredoxin oxidoreductase family protein [Deltaproteobacteria bacterium]MBW2154364.1 aldehyde ferredoxin oxidoreductase family protein [Deltaproteobacteria bacterium]
MMYAFAGKILYVNLSTGEVEKRTLYPEEVLKYLGSRGFNAHILWEMVPPGIDPLGAENVLIFGTGTLTATSAPTSGRTTITCKGPATGLYLKTNFGGHWGAELKFAGYDYIIIKGRSPQPVYLLIQDERVEIRDARELWGKDVRETTRAIEHAHGDAGIQVACIGPAGENRVAFAAILNSYYNSAARGGAGAVMGAKKLKAIAVCGHGSIRIADPQKFRIAVLEAIEASYEDFSARTSYLYGTSSSVAVINELGLFPSFNFKSGSIENAEKISGPYLVEAGYLKRRMGCNACIFSCHRYCEIDSGPYAGAYGGGPEYETMSALGAGCGTVDVETVIKANELCNLYGMDTISAGGVIQWAMESYEKGILDEEVTEGLKLKWGDAEAILSLLHKIAKREGFGDMLADGVRKAAQRIGQGSHNWAVEAKGLEQSRVETRGAFGYALAFAVNPRGPDHLHTEVLAEFGTRPGGRALVAKITGDERFAFPRTLEKRAEIVRWHEDCYAATDSLGLCAFATTARYGVTPQLMARMLSAAAGVDFTEESLMQAGRRIINIEKAFNVREGATRREDRLPYRLMNEVLPNLSTDAEDRFARGVGHPEPVKEAINSQAYLDQMLDEYYELHGWDIATGLPKKKTLLSLGLQKVARELERLGRIPDSGK